MNDDEMNDNIGYESVWIRERIEKLEKDVLFLLKEMPCSHRFPHDETETWDEEDENITMIKICRNCGERVD
jgi:hypothetical protein